MITICKNCQHTIMQRNWYVCTMFPINRDKIDYVTRRNEPIQFAYCFMKNKNGDCPYFEENLTMKKQSLFDRVIEKFFRFKGGLIV